MKQSYNTENLLIQKKTPYITPRNSIALFAVQILVEAFDETVFDDKCISITDAIARNFMKNPFSIKSKHFPKGAIFVAESVATLDIH